MQIMILNVLIHIIGSASTRAITKDTNLVIRFLAGGWCLCCFVLITVYSSVLISFLTTIVYNVRI